jgi:hypothetical protein
MILEGHMCRLLRAAVVVAIACVALPTAHAQTVRRLKGRIVAGSGAPIANATVRTEALFGYAADTFAGQRTFSTTTDNKGDWSIVGFKSGVWMFDISAPGYVPESLALPIQLLTTESSGMSGVAYNWQLVLKALPLPDGAPGQRLSDAATAAFAGQADKVRASFAQIPEDADADYLGGAGRIALVVRDPSLARVLFTKALEKDSTSYHAALGVASTFVMLRDFDNASRAFDAARNRTKDKDEQKFLTVAIGDLATIRVR